MSQSGEDRCQIITDDFDSFEGIMAFQSIEKGWVIGVSNRIKHAPRRHFTLAHEIGHFIGHRRLRERFECRFDQINDFEIDKLEIEANEFASQLLLPPDKVRTHFDGRRFDHESVTELASELGASKSAVAYRWINLSSGKFGFLISRDGMICSGRASDALYNAGTYFRSGTQINAGAATHKLREAGTSLTEFKSFGIWNSTLNCVETSFATTQQGYVYTFLDFENL